MRPHVKLARAVRRVRDIVPALDRGVPGAPAGVPGPVFVQLPVDLLYDEAPVRQWYAARRPGHAARARAVQAYLQLRVRHLFHGAPGRRTQCRERGRPTRTRGRADRRSRAAARRGPSGR